MVFLNIPGLQPNFAPRPFWMQPPWSRFRYLPRESLHYYFTSGNRTRPVKREFRIRMRETGGGTG